VSAEWQQLATAPQVALALDLDGTLLPFAPTPREAVIDRDTAALLDALVATPGVTLALVSGRPRELVEDIAQRFPTIAIAAEHGAWHGSGSTWQAALPAVAQLDEIEAKLRELARRYPGALVERKSCSVCLHYRQVEPPGRSALIALAEEAVDEWLETQPQLERLPVTLAIEIRHRAAHKGTAIAWLRARIPDATPILAIGDDATDEDMFTSLRDSDIGILVTDAPRRTEASLTLPSVTAVHRFLGWLVDARRAMPAPQPQDLVVARRPSRRTAPQLIVASNRLPAAPSAERGRQVGGLVSALLPVLEQTHGLWLGWSGAEREPGLRVRVEDSDAHGRAEFDYPPSWRELFYSGFCNRALWPLLHGFPEHVRYIDDEWRCYVDANRAYARILIELGDGGAEMWIQDFHLMLVARELRRAGHRGKVGFYLHVPFPPLDVLETMPWASELCAALLDYDRIGLQAQRWAENLTTSVRALLGAEAEARARERIRVIPVGIDPERFAEAAHGRASANDSLGAMLGYRKLILGVDRLDYSKGIPERLEAFARLLERFPEWRNEVSFVQVSVPTRSDVPEYGELRKRVEALVGRINGAYGEADWVPVRYLYRSYDQDTLARLYRQAAVGFVTPLRDGMNLVAKEYVAAQDPEQPGVLVLSKFAGAAETMPHALLANPYHADGLASELDHALRMGRDERVARHAALRESVWKHTAAAWANEFLAALRES